MTVGKSIAESTLELGRKKLTVLKIFNANFVFKAEELVLAYDGNTDQKASAVTYTYDTANGNLLTLTEWGEVLGGTDGTFTDTNTDKRVTTMTYATNPSLRIRGLPESELLEDVNGHTLKESQYYYVNNSYVKFMLLTYC